MGVDKVRVHRIEWRLKIAYKDEETKAQLCRSYICCGKYGHEEYKEIPSYCCPKVYEKCGNTTAFRKGCFEAMMDRASDDEMTFFLRNFVAYSIFLILGISVAASEASNLRYRRY